VYRNPQSFYEKLEYKFGPDVIVLNPKSLTSSIAMVAVDGSQLLSGWFQNSGKATGIRGITDGYALTAIPDHARHARHRIVVQQKPGAPSEAVIIEIDDGDFLEGCTNAPTILDHRTIGQPAVTGLIETYAENALVLNTSEAKALDQVYRGASSLAQLREYGVALRAQNAGVGYVEL
jgi:hypothetical protein